VDQWGNAVSNTYTLNGSFGSCVVVEGTGILMNNEMDDFSIKPGYPNKFGLVGNKANAIEADAWDVLQQTRMKLEERQRAATELKRRVYGEKVPDVREAHRPRC